MIIPTLILFSLILMSGKYVDISWEIDLLSSACFFIFSLAVYFIKNNIDSLPISLFLFLITDFLIAIGFNLGYYQEFLVLDLITNFHLHLVTSIFYILASILFLVMLYKHKDLLYSEEFKENQIRVRSLLSLKAYEIIVITALRLFVAREGIEDFTVDDVYGTLFFLIIGFMITCDSTSEEIITEMFYPEEKNFKMRYNEIMQKE